MDLFSLALAFLGVVVVLGALVQTFIPGWISEQTSDSLSALTLAIVGIVISTWGMMLFLQRKNREGFQTQSGLDRWKTFAETQRLEDVCSLYTDLYEKIKAVEKGTPPDTVLTDAQAREKTDQRFASRMSVPPLPCGKVSEALKATTDATLAPVLLQLPTSLGVQSYETAVACRSLLIESYGTYQDAKRRAEEGFDDLCTEDQLQEQKAAESKPPLSDEAKRCKKPDEVPPEQLKATIDERLSTLEQVVAASTRKDPLGKVIDDCLYYRTELEKEKKKAEDTSNKYQFR
jgi:hypothetical protein